MPCKRLCTLAVGLLGLLLCGSRVGADPQEQARMEALWAELASTDEAQASRALLRLSATPGATIAFLKARLRPVRVDPALFGKLITQLDDDEYSRREEASRKLAELVEYLGKAARAHLEARLKDGPSPEVERRLQALIEQIPGEPAAPLPPPQLRGRNISVRSNNGNITIFVDGKPLDLTPPAPPPPPRPNTQWLRATRAIALLETMGGVEARAILASLAEGEENALPTREARLALKRLSQPGK